MMHPQSDQGLTTIAPLIANQVLDAGRSPRLRSARAYLPGIEAGYPRFDREVSRFWPSPPPLGFSKNPGLGFTGCFWGYGGWE